MISEEKKREMVISLKLFSAKMVEECRNVIANDPSEWRRNAYKDYLTMYEGFLLAPAEELLS